MEGHCRDGGGADAERIESSRRLFEMLAAEPRLDATSIQTVGDKVYDGFAIALANPE